jgi:tagatose-6-phosphate ketose/aldose isomerase
MIIETKPGKRDPIAELMNLSSDEKSRRGLAHTPREIWQQPGTWATTFLGIVERRDELQGFLSKSLDENPTVYLVGAGSSDYVGRALTSILRKNWNCDVIAIPSTEIVTNIDNFVVPGKPYLWISFSRSGESSEGVGALEKALRLYPQIRHLVVACDGAGRMPQMCSGRENALALVLDDAVNDRGLAMTSSFTNMVVAGQCLANLPRLREYHPTLETLVAMGQKMLERSASLAESLSQLQLRKACFVGSGALAAAATECALKTQELTAGSIYAMAESTMGLRHGPMSALDDDSLVVSLISSDETRSKYEVDLLAEMQAKGLGRIRIAIAPAATDRLLELCHHVIALDAPTGFPDDYRTPVDVIFGQLLGLFASLSVGLQPDRPSPNGTIARVVSHVKIY